MVGAHLGNLKCLNANKEKTILLASTECRDEPIKFFFLKKTVLAWEKFKFFTYSSPQKNSKVHGMVLAWETRNWETFPSSGACCKKQLLKKSSKNFRILIHCRCLPGKVIIPKHL
jgi:hypothetical protein